MHWKMQSVIFCFFVHQKCNTWYLQIDVDLLSILLHLLFPGNYITYLIWLVVCESIAHAEFQKHAAQRTFFDKLTAQHFVLWIILVRNVALAIFTFYYYLKLKGKHSRILSNYVKVL